MIASILKISLKAAATTSKQDDPRETATRGITQLARALADIASIETPLALVIDEAQYLDASSCGVLFRLAGEVRHRPLLVVVGYPDETLTRNPPLKELHDALVTGNNAASQIKLEKLHRGRGRLDTSRPVSVIHCQSTLRHGCSTAVREARSSHRNSLLRSRERTFSYMKTVAQSSTAAFAAAVTGNGRSPASSRASRYPCRSRRSSRHASSSCPPTITRSSRPRRSRGASCARESSPRSWTRRNPTSDNGSPSSEKAGSSS